MTYQHIRAECAYWATYSGKAKHAISWWKERRLRQSLQENRVACPPRQHASQDCIVSLTTWEPRLECLPLTLLTLIRQSVRPTRIIVWMTSADRRRLCQSTKQLFEDNGVEFLECEDLGPHKKWFFTRNLPGDPLIILADDDIFYSPEWLKSLLNESAVADQYIAHRCHRIVVDDQDAMRPYGLWKKEVREFGRASHALFATGGAGAAFRPSWIPPDFYKTALIHDLCPTADDVWLKCAMLHAGIKVRKTAVFLPIFGPREAEQHGLERANVHNDMNTLQMTRTMHHFGLSMEQIVAS